MSIERRRWLTTFGLGAVTRRALAARPRADEPACPAGDEPLRLQDFRPGRCCTSKETHVSSPRFPVIDVHTHFTFTASETQGRRRPARRMSFNTAAAAARRGHGPKGVKAVVNLTGGTGKGLEATLAAFDRARPGRFFTLHGAELRRLLGSALSADPGRRDREGGARGAARPQDPEDPRPRGCASGSTDGPARQGGRPALRPDVGGVRRAQAARLHPRLGPRGVLPADRLHERALGRARPPPRVVVPRRATSRATAS